jgi:rusticyanin
MSRIPILAVVLVVIGLGSFLAVFAYTAYTAYMARAYQPWLEQRPYWVGQQQNTPGPVGGYGYGGMMGQWMSTSGQSVTIQQAIQSMRETPSYATVVTANNTVNFHSQSINIFALAIMPDKAVNLTGMHPPSYSSEDVFVIYGLINPTLLIRSGASVQFTVVNLDDDMYHNLVVSPVGPPYPYMAMQGMMSGRWAPFLPPADYSQGTAHEYSYALTFNQPGIFWYLCTYPDHAESGMYGEIEVVN